MTYRPQESVFGPPLAARIPSVAYLLLALGVVVLVLVGESSASGTWLFHYVVEEDLRRVMSIRTFAAILVVSSVASLVRTNMRGVRIYPDGVEARDVMALVPKLKRYRWPQIDGIVLDGRHHVALDLWDGSRAYLPTVSDRSALALALEQIAAARAIPVRGGSLSLDEIDAAAEEDDES
jgi:hypothetical protein